LIHRKIFLEILKNWTTKYSNTDSITRDNRDTRITLAGKTNWAVRIMSKVKYVMVIFNYHEFCTTTFFF